jgi:opacity protein-like surface antigen
MKKLYFIITTYLILFSLTAFAATQTTNSQKYNSTGWYVSASAGPAFMPNIDEVDSLGDRVTREMKTGAQMSIAVGFKRGYYRPEVQFLAGGADIKSWDYRGSRVTNIDGDVVAVGFMFNNIFDINIPNSNFVPYLGVGVGAIAVEEEITASNGYKLEESSGGIWAMQLMAGAKYYFTEHISVFLDYRYMLGADSNYIVKINGVKQGTLEQRYQNHVINLGIQYYF